MLYDLLHTVAKKDHTAVFSDQAALGNRNIVVSQADEDNFSAKVYRSYI